MYAVLHSPSYREKYKEFLKIDFPRVPYPKHAKEFYDLVALGSQLRKLHLLESEETENYITQYPIDGDNLVVKPVFVPAVISNEEQPVPIHREGEISLEEQIATPAEKQARNDENVMGKVYINETQYFDHVPQVAWNFYIGGYQPAQKWLKDRKGRTLEFDDILHYQKIIKALSRTGEIMAEIDKVMEV
ncbi:type ISP restriction/modification enzyme [Pedobacter changchengzhani]|uniref:type ISP restriction/modification enzyme n=1 Tax=Pedobacter changchengzhani TaxID=2529274 RepID=UPI001A9FE1A6|nr:type ISP restriction/modification enzyme [Pedobacter changchengzhani]